MHAIKTLAAAIAWSGVVAAARTTQDCADYCEEYTAADGTLCILQCLMAPDGNLTEGNIEARDLPTECRTAPVYPVMASPASYVVPTTSKASPVSYAMPATSESSQAVYQVTTPSEKTPDLYVVPTTSKASPVSYAIPATSESTKAVYQVTTPSEKTPASYVVSSSSHSTKPHAIYPTGHYSAPTSAKYPATESASTPSYSKPHSNTTVSKAYAVPTPSETIISLGGAAAGYSAGAGAVILAFAAMLPAVSSWL